MFQLEKYYGTKSRYTCPNCHARRVFARYINERGEYLNDSVGRCNRDSKCGYHFTPKMFYEANPNRSQRTIRTISQKSATVPAKQVFVRQLQKQPDYIDFGILLKTQTDLDRNSFVQFLLELFFEDTDLVRQTVKNYLIGTMRDGKTVFWQVDQERLTRTGKIIAYDRKTGKRRKDVSPTWTHSELKRARLLKENFNLTQCFFGEHLLEDGQQVAIVEAEKTAVIASMCFPEFIWLACGSKQNLKAEKLKRLGSRRILLYPDADGFELWREVARDACRLGLRINVSSLIEDCATDEQRANGYDLADYLIEEQPQINEQNSFADKYNAAVDSILNDQRLMSEFNRRLDSLIADEETIRNIVISITKR
jgi:hypothetical protein